MFHPRLIFLIPADGESEPVFPGDTRAPAEFRFAFRRVDRITPIVPGPVFDELDKIMWFAQCIEYRPHDIDILLFVPRPDVVNLSRPTVIVRQPDRPRMV